MLPIIAPTSHPAEVINISPEALEVANCYLQLQDISKVVDELSISAETVTQILEKREVKAYIDHVFMNLGFNNRFKMRQAMDAIMSKKFQELDEAGVGSGKDILEIMALSHKITMEHMAAQTALEKAKEGATRSQTNVQINSEGTNYNALIERLISGT